MVVSEGVDALVSPDNFSPRAAPGDGYNIRNGLCS